MESPAGFPQARLSLAVPRDPLRAPYAEVVVLNRDEVKQVMEQLTGTMWIIVVLLYGTGLRIQDCIELRVKDLDFDRNHADVSTTMIYLHVLNRGALGVRSPVDRR